MWQIADVCKSFGKVCCFISFSNMAYKTAFNFHSYLFLFFLTTWHHIFLQIVKNNNSHGYIIFFFLPFFSSFLHSVKQEQCKVNIKQQIVSTCACYSFTCTNTNVSIMYSMHDYNMSA